VFFLAKSDCGEETTIVIGDKITKDILPNLTNEFLIKDGTKASLNAYVGRLWEAMSIYLDNEKGNKDVKE
jgi:hypothetical protein